MKYYIGIDVGGTGIKAGVVDENGKIIYKKSVKTGANRTPEEVIKDMALLCKDVAEESEIGLDNVTAVGMGVPGSIDSENGAVRYANNLNWKDVHIVEIFQKYVNVPLKISNDANVAALGEAKFGAGNGAKNAFLFTLGTGVGSGIIIDGKIFEGNYSAGAEFGHTVLVIDGEQCTCGRKGCIEAYASATALIRDTKRAIEKHPESMMYKEVEGNLDNVNGITAFKCARAGDEVALKVVENYERYIAEAVTDAINVFRPDVVMLGGGICAEGEYLLKPIREFANKFNYGGDTLPYTKIVRAELGNDAGIIGAAALVM